jgi:hypothetical protein
MKEAMEQSLISIMEVTEGGHVPELKVKNHAKIPVLLLDGEELSGAKQNRVLNTTILLKELCETVIPVSCTEHGRWSYTSEHFEESGIMSSISLRRVKNTSVGSSLRGNRGYKSDQSAVWNTIAKEAEAAGVESSTGAMRDVHKAKEVDLDAYLEHFTLIPYQKGLLVMVNGDVAGMDMVSNASSFEILYPKLLKSYVMDAILSSQSKDIKPNPEKAKTFVEDIQHCTEQGYKSVGHGWDYRYEGRKIVGSALVHEATVIHAAFFKTTQAEKSGYMSSFSRRKTYRMQ